MKYIIPIILIIIMVELAYGADFNGWMSLSLRKAKVEEAPFDYEWQSGVGDKYSEISWLFERENKKKYRGVFFKHDKDWLKVQYYYKEANSIDTLSIIGKTKKQWKKVNCDYGSSYVVDWTKNIRTFMTYVKIYQKAWHISWQTSGAHNILEMEYSLKNKKGLSPKVLYYRADNNYFWQLKLVWKIGIIK